MMALAELPSPGLVAALIGSVWLVCIVGLLLALLMPPRKTLLQHARQLAGRAIAWLRTSMRRAP